MLPMNTTLFLERLSQLVATPSVSCTTPALDMGNRPVVELLANWLEPMGFAIEIMPVGDNPNKVNLIATLGQGPGGLVFSGHTDTVPYDEYRWQQDPFSLNINNERAYGLGATDMKGFFPVALAAIETFLDTPRQWRQPLIILATADEESSMTGARELVKQGRPKARFAVEGEPTSMQPIRMHKGITMESIRVEGQAGHSSDPSLGNNAIDTIHDVIGDLKIFRQHLQQQHQHPGFNIAVPTLNLGCIHGGDNPNRIGDHCELVFDIRPLPCMSLDDFRASVDQRITDIADKNQIAIKRTSIFPGVDAFEQPANSPLIQAVESLTGHTAQSVAFATEAPFLQSLGMDVVVMGPGSIDQAHQPDEFIALDQIEPAINVLRQLIQRFCL